MPRCIDPQKERRELLSVLLSMDTTKLSGTQSSLVSVLAKLEQSDPRVIVPDQPSLPPNAPVLTTKRLVVAAAKPVLAARTQTAVDLERLEDI